MYLINASDQYHQSNQTPTLHHYTASHKNVNFDIVSIIKSKIEMKAMQRSDYE